MLPLIWILIIARFIIAIQLIRVSRQYQLSNLLWLASFFLITGTGDIFLTLTPITNLILPFSLSVGLGEVMMVMFIQKTFYQDRKSPYLIFMVIALLILVANIFALFPYFSPFNWLWLIWVGNQAYKKITGDPSVEDWVKARYKLVIAYSLVALAAPFYTVLGLLAFPIPALAAVLFAPTASQVASTAILAFTTVGIALEYLAWVMPESYRRYLNRNYQAPVPNKAEMELSEEEIMRRLQDRT